MTHEPVTSTTSHRDPTVVYVGGVVSYRGGFGTFGHTHATVTHLTITDEPREKDGADVEQADWTLVQDNRVLFGLDDGHWCYADQVDSVSRDGVVVLTNKGAF